MAIAISTLVQNKNNSDGTTYTVASSTYTSGRLYLLACVLTNPSPSAPTVTPPGGLTATLIDTCIYGVSSTYIEACYRIYASSTQTGTMTISLASSTGCLWSVSEVTGTAITGTNAADAIVQFGNSGLMTSIAVSRNVSVTNNLTKVGNCLWTGGSAESSYFDLGVTTTDFTNATQQNNTSPSTCHNVAWNVLPPAVTVKLATWDAAGSQNYGAVMAELALAPTSDTSYAGMIPI